MSDPNTTPSFQATPGEPYLEAPVGTKVRDNAGVAVNVTGVPLTAAPESNAEQTGDAAVLASIEEGFVTITGLHSMTDDSVGRTIVITGAAHAENNGSFEIVGVFSPTAILISNIHGIVPDANSGAIAWTELVDPAAFPPGDPLTSAAEQAVDFYVLQATDGPMEGGGAEDLPPNTNVPDPALPVQETGKNQPRVAPTGATAGPVVNNSGYPVREVPSALLLVNEDPFSPAFGLEPVIGDGPAAVNLGTALVPEPVPTGSTGGGVVYPTANPVVFSR